MRKKPLFVLASVLAFSSITSPALATSTISEEQPYKQATKEDVVQKYEGVSFYSSEPLSEDHMEMILDMSEQKKSVAYKGQNIEGSISPDSISTNVYVPTSPYSGTITIGPYYRTYSNIEARAAIAALSWILTERLKLTKFRSAVLAGASFGASESLVPPTHVGTWRYKAYDPNVKRYREFATVVHFKYGSFTSPTKVQTYPMFYY